MDVIRMDDRELKWPISYWLIAFIIDALVLSWAFQLHLGIQKNVASTMYISPNGIKASLLIFYMECRKEVDFFIVESVKLELDAFEQTTEQTTGALYNIRLILAARDIYGQYHRIQNDKIPDNYDRFEFYIERSIFEANEADLRKYMPVYQIQVYQRDDHFPVAPEPPISQHSILAKTIEFSYSPRMSFWTTSYRDTYMDIGDLDKNFQHRMYSNVYLAGAVRSSDTLYPEHGIRFKIAPDFRVEHQHWLAQKAIKF